MPSRPILADRSDPDHRLEHRHARRADVQVDARAFFAQLGRIARIAQHGFAVAADQQIAVVAGKAGQIGDVRKSVTSRASTPVLKALRSRSRRAI